MTQHTTHTDAPAGTDRYLIFLTTVAGIVSVEGIGTDAGRAARRAAWTLVASREFGDVGDIGVIAVYGRVSYEGYCPDCGARLYVHVDGGTVDGREVIGDPYGGPADDRRTCSGCGALIEG